MTIAAWEDFELARSMTESEANSMAELFWLAGELPDPEGERIQELVRSYAKVVTDEEWALMEQGQASPRAWDLTDEIRSSIYGFEPDSGAEQVLYDQGLTLVRDLVDERRLRLLEVREGIPHILWGVVVVGGVIVVGFTYLFGLENTWAHTLMIASLAAIIALVVFTIYALDRPFTGITRVHPDAFELRLETFTQNPERS